MGILDRLTRRTPKKGIDLRMYAGAKNSRLTAGWGTSNTSADSELVSSLTTLRARSRQLVRDAPYAKRAKVIIQNNVVGAGIGMQAQVKTERGDLSKRINDGIEAAWCDWVLADNCHVGGELHLADLERMAMGEVFEAGEILIRKHYTKVGDSRVPLALEIIEAERLADDYQVPGPLAENAVVRMGVETDKFHRPIAYWLRERHPGETRWNDGPSERLERVPADQIYHLRIVDRWPQTRGEPWLHAVLRKLNDLDGYSEAEIVAARAAACYMGIIETPDEQGDPTTATATGSTEVVLESGEIKRLNPGEKFSSFNPNRPNSGADPFLRFMLREIAAGAGTSYESISRDYSQSNYSSSRLALIDDRDLWRTLQLWFIRSFREPLHREFINMAVMARAVDGVPIDQYAANPAKFSSVRFKPRGWSWIDPTKEVEAYKEAVRAGFTTVSDVIALTGSGRDIEDVLDERERELKLMAEKGLKFDTEFKEPPAAAPAAPASEPEDDEEPEEESETDNAERIARAVGNAISETVRNLKAPQALVTVGQPAVTVNTPTVQVDNRFEVPAPQVHVAAPEVRVENHIDTPAPVVNVAAPEVRVENTVPVPQVNVAAPEVRVENAVHVPPAHDFDQIIERDEHGEMVRVRHRTIGKQAGS